LSSLTEGYDPRALLTEMKLACFSCISQWRLCALKARIEKKKSEEDPRYMLINSTNFTMKISIIFL
jgi:hypothetical protein